MDPSPRINSILFHEADIVLRFFAFAIIRVLHTTGTNDDHTRINCEPVYRTVYLKCLQEFPDNWIRSFHLYIAEMEYYESRSTRSKSKKDRRAVHNNGSSCHLIRSIAFGSQIHAENTILASSSPENVTFILPAKAGVPGHFQYIEIPVHHILQLTPHAEGTLGLSFDTIGPIMMDGKERVLHGSTAYMTADSDLQDLCTAIRGNGQKIRKGQIIRRTSSTVVELDTGEEVARKSIQHSKKLSQVSDHRSGLSDVEINDYNDEKLSEIQADEQDEPHVGPKLAQKTSSLNENLLLTSQIAAIPTNTPSRTNELRTLEEEPIPKQRNESIQDLEDDLSSPVSYKGTPRDTLQNEHQEPKFLASQPESTTNPTDDLPGPNKTDLVNQNLQRRVSRKRNGRMSSQKGPERRSTRRRISTNRNDRSNLPDTQESLLFPRPRRPNKKVYTSNSKAAVDWEEDLRPTEDDQGPETEIRQDIEVTSVSSPAPGDTSIFNKSSTTKPKRKARVTPSLTRGKKRTQRRKAATSKRKKTNRLPLQTKTSNSSNINHETAIGREAKETTKDTENEKTYVPTEAKNPRSTDPAGDANAVTPATYQSSLKYGSVKAPQGDCEIATVKAGEQESTPRSNRNGSQMMTNSIPRKGYLRSKVQDSSDKATMISKRISESTAPADEKGSMRCASAQESQVPDVRSYRQTYSESANLLRPQHDALGLKAANEDHTTGIEAQEMVDTTRSGSQHSELERGSPVLNSGKRTAVQEFIHEGQTKKSRMAVASMPDQQEIDQSTNATTAQLDQGGSKNNSFSKETLAAIKDFPKISAHGRRPTFPSTSPQSRSSASDRASELSTIHMSSPGEPAYLNSLSSTSPKKSIVDENGSPRLISRRFHDNTPFNWRGSRHLRFERDVYSLEEASSQSGYHGDSDDVDFTTPSLSGTCSISKRSLSRSVSASSSDANEMEETSFPNKRCCMPITERLRRAQEPSEQSIKAMITPFSLTASPQKAKPAFDTEYNRGMKAPYPALQPSPSIASVSLEQELAQLSKRVEGSQSQASWQASLEAIQKALHDMLLNTSEVSLIVISQDLKTSILTTPPNTESHTPASR